MQAEAVTDTMTEAMLHVLEVLAAVIRDVWCRDASRETREVLRCRVTSSDDAIRMSNAK